MTEPVIGIAGAVLLVLAITALFLRPRRSRGRVVDTGLAVGAGLLGLAIGLVVAERVNGPAIVALAAPEQPPDLPQPATQGLRYVETRLSLQFPIDDEYPSGSEGANRADRYAPGPGKETRQDTAPEVKSLGSCRVEVAVRPPLRPAAAVQPVECGFPRRRFALLPDRPPGPALCGLSRAGALPRRSDGDNDE